MPDDPIKTNDSRAQEIVDRAVARAIQDTFRLLGVDITEMHDLNELRDDFRYIRRQRDDAETRRTEVSKSVITAMIGGFIGMLLSAGTWLITILRHQP